jgi:hypothetical protein
MNFDSAVAADFPSELMVSDIDCNHFFSPPLQQAIGETSSGGPDIQTDQIGRIDYEMVQRRFQLITSAPDVLFLGDDSNHRVGSHECPGLVYHVLLDQDLTRQNRSLGTLPRTEEPMIYEKFVDPDPLRLIHF